MEMDGSKKKKPKLLKRRKHTNKNFWDGIQKSAKRGKGSHSIEGTGGRTKDKRALNLLPSLRHQCEEARE